MFSCSITNVTALPPLPQPKHLNSPFDGDTTNEGVFSLWNGQQA